MVGDYWTKYKLERIEAHLSRFTREMNEGRFQTLYVDAFAGDGTVYFKEKETSRPSFDLQTSVETSVPGSARRAMSAKPSFDKYLLNDKNVANCWKLKQVRDEYPVRDRVFVKHRDANEFVLDVCKTTDWKTTRAVFVLDPYGMQFRWETLEAIAGTKAADVWYLFPSSAVDRMLPKKGITNEAAMETLRRTLGIQQIKQQFYRTRVQKGFSGNFEHTRKNKEPVILNLMVERFSALFPFVLWPKLVENRAGSTMFLLFFASAIPGERETTKFMEKLMLFPFDAPLPTSLRP